MVRDPFSGLPPPIIPLPATNCGDIVYQVKAVARGSKVSHRATSASDALRLFRQTQASSGVTSCAVFQKGVLLSQSELEQAARREENLSAKLG